MRLAGLYALLDGRDTMERVHLKAALAVWQHAEASTKMIFGDSLGDPVADTMLKPIHANGEQTDSQLSDLFGRHMSAAKLGQAKFTLSKAGLIHGVTVETNGRPRIVWRVGAKKAN